MDVLIDAAAKSQVEALYCFYNGYWPRSTIWRPSCGNLIHDDAYGCTLAVASSVQAVNSHRLTKIAPVSVAWSDLVCCGTSHLPFPDRARDVLRSLGGGTQPILDALPDHAQASRRNELSPDDPRLEGLAGIVVIEQPGG